MRTRYFLLLLIAAFVTLLMNCKKKSEAPPPLNPGDLTVLPLDEADFHVMVPLGNINPPAHTFPSDHGGFYVKNFGTPSNVKSPGKLRIYSISRDRHGVGLPSETQDYSIYFGYSNGYRLWLGHMATISPQLLAAANNFAGASCNQYIAGVLQEQCRASVSVDVEPGQILGTAGTVPGQYGLDFGYFNDGKYECVLPFFTEPLRNILRARTGSYDPVTSAVVLRTKEPYCGEVYQDIAGTLQGIWLRQGQPKYPEDPHIGFLKDMVDPDKPIISIGNSLGSSSGGRWTFTPIASGSVSRKFSEVTPDGNTYCYNTNFATASIIVKMNDSKNIQVEYRPSCNCSCQTSYAFSSAVKGFSRE